MGVTEEVGGHLLTKMTAMWKVLVMTTAMVRYHDVL